MVENRADSQGCTKRGSHRRTGWTATRRNSVMSLWDALGKLLMPSSPGPRTRISSSGQTSARLKEGDLNKTTLFSKVSITKDKEKLPSVKEDSGDDNWQLLLCLSQAGPGPARYLSRNPQNWNTYLRSARSTGRAWWHNLGIPATLGDEARRFRVWGQPGQFRKTQSWNKNWEKEELAIKPPNRPLAQYAVGLGFNL